MKTKAIVFRAANTPTLEELDIPALAPDEVRVRVQFSGVSIGTESSIFSGVRTHNGTFPLVGGYMASGVIDELGPEVKGLNAGDRVVACGVRLAGGVTSVWGGHSSMQVVKARGVTRIPDGAEMAHAAMYVMPGVGLNAANMAEVKMTDTVLIQGQGLIGQLCGQWCRNRGAKVIAIEPDPRRAGLSRKYVTANVIDPTTENVEARVAELTGGKGPTVVVEATASAKFIDNATRFLRPGGRMVFLSWYPGHISIDFAHFHNNQITAFFPTGSGGDAATQATLWALANGTIRMDGNITDTVPYTDACRGYERLIAGDRSVMGMVIDWR
ncbi:MAG: hypothetical protein A3K19_18640 [Lentisphaerae bacterium RIFOXYB12_FULL_65_16]|nr:MAG: hypothetical protein A3K18_00960 [Lentisphaerae bacterium RIFOXYA12_64_32]OGV92364.1 MAG: hypothetical protein A3K19_18640 [Lentisphaerae bacterium RIFOXYB12_FULL_65_16]